MSEGIKTKDLIISNIYDCRISGLKIQVTLRQEDGDVFGTCWNGREFFRTIISDDQLEELSVELEKAF